MRLTWHVEVSGAAGKLKLGPPPYVKIKELLLTEIKARIKILESEFRDLWPIIGPYWDRDIRFTTMDGKPAYTKPRKRGKKKGRRDLYFIEDDAILEAWKFDRKLIEFLDMLRGIEKLLEFTLWGLRAHIQLPFPRKKEIIDEYEQLLEWVSELKDSVKEWREKRLEYPRLPEWLRANILSFDEDHTESWDYYPENNEEVLEVWED